MLTLRLIHGLGTLSVPFLDESTADHLNVPMAERCKQRSNSILGSSVHISAVFEEQGNHTGVFDIMQRTGSLPMTCSSSQEYPDSVPLPRKCCSIQGGAPSVIGHCHIGVVL